MTLSAEKLDIDDKIAQISAQIEKLKQDRAILKRGIDSIDEEGESMLQGKGILATEVRQIMRGRD